MLSKVEQLSNWKISRKVLFQQASSSSFFKYSEWKSVNKMFFSEYLVLIVPSGGRTKERKFD